MDEEEEHSLSDNYDDDGDDNDIEIDGKEEGNTEERPGIFDFIKSLLNRVPSVPCVPWSALRPYVPACPACLACPTCLRALRASRALRVCVSCVPCVPSCLACPMRVPIYKLRTGIRKMLIILSPLLIYRRF